MRPLRIAVIGAGMIGRRHARIIQASADCSLAGIADPDPAAAEFARGLGAGHYPSLPPLLDRERPDAVVVATPNHLHAPQAIECARAGIHLLVEKPLADTSAAAWELVAAADAAGVVASVGHHRRHYPVVRQARDIVADGRIGRLVGASVIWATLKSDEYFAQAWRRQPGGGPMMNNMIHDVDLLRFICGDIVEVYARTSNAIRGFAVEDSAAVTLLFANGALANVLLSDTAASPWSFEMATGESWQIAYSGQNTSQFIGTAGSLEFPNLRLWSHADPAQTGWHHPLAARRLKPADLDVYAEQIRHFCAVIRGDERPIAAAVEGARSLDVTLAIARSAREGVPHKLDVVAAPA